MHRTTPAEPYADRRQLACRAAVATIRRPYPRVCRVVGAAGQAEIGNGVDDDPGDRCDVLTGIDQAIADKKPLLLQFWQPHWKQSKVELVEVKLPDITADCDASREAGDGKYACDYPVDKLYKAASAKLKDKNAKAFDILSKLSLTNDQQSEIAASIDGDGLKPEAAAQKWVDANKAIWSAWLG